SDSGCDVLSHSPETLLAAWTLRFGVHRFASLLEGTFGDNDDTEMFAQAFTHHDRVDDFRRIVRDLGNQDNVCTACNSGVGCNPACVPSHDLDDDDSSMALSSRVQFVESVASGTHSSVEAKSGGRASNIVINSLRDADERNALLIESFCDGQRAVAADHDERIQTKMAEIRNDPVGEIAFDSRPFVVEYRVGKRICSIGSAQNGAAEMKNAGDTRLPQWPSLTMHQPVKAFFYSEDFPAEANGCFDGRADNGIQRRTVSTA